MFWAVMGTDRWELLWDGILSVVRRVRESRPLDELSTTLGNRIQSKIDLRIFEAQSAYRLSMPSSNSDPKAISE